jgi:hypothetical protein
MQEFIKTQTYLPASFPDSASALVIAVLVQAARDARGDPTMRYQYRDRYGRHVYCRGEASQWLAGIGAELADELCWMGDNVRRWVVDSFSDTTAKS